MGNTGLCHQLKYKSSMKSLWPLRLYSTHPLLNLQGQQDRTSGNKVQFVTGIEGGRVTGYQVIFKATLSILPYKYICLPSELPPYPCYNVILTAFRLITVTDWVNCEHSQVSSTLPSPPPHNIYWDSSTVCQGIPSSLRSTVHLRAQCTAVSQR